MHNFFMTYMYVIIEASRAKMQYYKKIKLYFSITGVFSFKTYIINHICGIESFVHIR